MSDPHAERWWELYYTVPPGDETPPSNIFHLYRRCPALSDARVVSELAPSNPLTVRGPGSDMMPGWECDDGERRHGCAKCKDRVRDEYGASNELPPDMGAW